MTSQYITVRVFGETSPSYRMQVVSDPVRVLERPVSDTDITNTMYVLYTCTVLWQGSPMRVYLSTWNMFEDTILMQYWDTNQTLSDLWLAVLIEQELKLIAYREKQNAELEADRLIQKQAQHNTKVE